MKNLKILFLPLLFFIFYNGLQAQKMNNQKIDKILKSNVDSVGGQTGAWQFKYFDRYFLLLTDEKNNRMRIISPIIEENKLDKDLLAKCLKANFHTTLDVKYALSQEILWSVYIHPLKELSQAQLVDAIKQVYRAAATFGYSFSSTDLIFGGEDE
jgi:hypothetical protein